MSDYCPLCEGVNVQQLTITLTENHGDLDERNIWYVQLNGEKLGAATNNPRDAVLMALNAIEARIKVRDSK